MKKGILLAAAEAALTAGVASAASAGAVTGTGATTAAITTVTGSTALAPGTLNTHPPGWHFAHGVRFLTFASTELPSVIAIIAILAQMLVPGSKEKAAG